MNLRKGLAILIATMVCLSGIYAGGAEEAGGAGASVEKIPLTMWFWGATPDQQQAMDDILVSRFNAEHPEYELSVEYRPSVNKDMAVALAAGEGPDIVYESSPSLSLIYIQSGKYADLSEYAEKYGWDEKIIKPMYDSSSVDGHLYSIPMGLNFTGFVYNKKVLDENGWSVPTTVDEFVSIMDQAAAKGMYAVVAGNKGWKAANEDQVTLFLNAFAGPEEVYKCLTGEQDWNSEWIRHAIETSAEWYQKGYLCTDYFNLDKNECMQLLVDGRSPFFLGPVKFIQQLSGYLNEENQDDFGFAVFPSGREGIAPSYSFGATGILALNAESEHKDVCAEFLNMFVNADFVKEMAQVWPGYWGVPLTNLSELDISDMDGISRKFLDALVVASDEINKGNFGYFCSSYMPPETFDLFCNIERVWLDQMSVEDFLSEIDVSFDREAAQNLVPPVPAPGV